MTNELITPPRATTMTFGGDLQLGRIGYGAMPLTGPNLWGEYPDHDGGIELLRQAVEAGVISINRIAPEGTATQSLPSTRGPRSL